METIASREPVQRFPHTHARVHVLSAEDVGGEVVDRVLGTFAARADESALDALLHETIYRERLRLAEDPHDDEGRRFVADLLHDLASAVGDVERKRFLVRRVAEHYTGEIGGHFDRRVYGVATRLLPGALGTLLHGGHEPLTFDVDQRIHLEGDIGLLRALTKKGTVLLAPTHVSNLDSPVLGWAIHRLGLPPFAYAAGLNLFSNPVIGYFMRHLGAYTVDRRKTDPFYKEVLKQYTATLLERGQHGLVFPGGTRSRSGSLEPRLKLGLLGTLPLAFRRALATRGALDRARYYVVPCTISYPLVLEASSLIEDWLRTEGGPRSVELADEFERPRRWADFLRGIRALDVHIVVRFGRPLDVVGNDVDDEGESRDPRGRRVDPSGYFTVRGALHDDPRRDAEYTRELGERLLASYRRENVALPSSVVAFAAFERVRREGGTTDLFRLLRTLAPGRELRALDLEADIERVVKEISASDGRGPRRGFHESDPRAILAQALATFGTYHATPVLERRGDRVRVGDASLLFYYRNHIDGYGLGGSS